MGLMTEQVALTVLMQRIADELDRLERLAASMQDEFSPMIQDQTLSEGISIGLQHLDHVQQAMRALGEFVRAIEASVPTAAIDISIALASLPLSDMAGRLGGCGHDTQLDGDVDFF